VSLFLIATSQRVLQPIYELKKIIYCNAIVRWRSQTKRKPLTKQPSAVNPGALDYHTKHNIPLEKGLAKLYKENVKIAQSKTNF